MPPRRTPWRPWLVVLIVLLATASGYLRQREAPDRAPAADSGQSPAVSSDTGDEVEHPQQIAKSSPPSTNQSDLTTSDASQPHETSEDSLRIRGVVIRSESGKVVYRGDVDLAPTLARIAAGEKHPHRNDGGVFRNLEGRLPKRPTGYYREYVHPTPGLSGPGPQRVVLGRQGEVYYTSDHYRTFQRIQQ